MNSFRTQFLPVAIVVILLLSTIGFGQSFQATLLGRVVDPSGAVIPNADVVVKNEATGLEQTGSTNKEGLFAIPQLVPGIYTVTVTGKGFAPTVESGLELTTGQTARLELRLQIAGHAETVEIVSTAPVVNTDTSNKGEVMVNRQVNELPLNGRDFTDLSLLVAGVYARPDKDDQGQGLSVAGTRTDTSNFTLDGVNNRSDRNGGVGVNTSVDSIREFSVNTSTYAAEFGRTAGGQVTVVSKSGTNQIHGSLFEYTRNNVLDAKNYFTDPRGKALVRNQFGASIGGPIIKNKTFYFGSYEGTREHRSQNDISKAPLAPWLNGDFSQMRGPGADGILGNADDTNRVLSAAWNPVTNKWVRSEMPGCSAANPSACNIIPKSMWSPVSAAFVQYYPASNVAPLDTAYNSRGIDVTNRNQILFKLDHTFSNANNAYVRWARQKGDGYASHPSNRNFYPNMGSNSDSRSDTFALNDSHLFSPSVINEFRFGVFDQHNYIINENNDQDWIKTLGLTGLNPGTDMQGMPAVRIDGFSENGDRPNYPFIYQIRNYQIYDAMTIVRGRHQMKFGGDMTFSKYDETDMRNIRGDFRFRGYFSNPLAKTSSGMYSFADFLMGQADATQRQVGAPPTRLRGWQFSQFFQDDFRVSSFLTLNLGVRYDLQLPMHELNGRLANFFPEDGKSFTASERTLLKTRHNNIAPRVGFALRPFGNDKTVIRGGGGIFYSLETSNVTRQQLAVTSPFIIREQYSKNSSAGLAPTFADPFPAALALLNGVAQPLGVGYENQTPTVYQYNLTMERELMQDLALEVGYVGSQGRHLGRRLNLNEPMPTGEVTCSTAAGPPPVTTCTPVTARRWANLDDVTFQQMMASSNYNALQTNLRRRAKNGLTMLVSYTWSRALDDASSTNISTTGSQKTPQDISNLRSEYGLADFHRKHQFKAAVNYTLPFGRKQRFLSHSGPLVEKLVGGWQVNSTIQIMSGRPFTPQYNSGGVTSQRPDVVGDPYKDVPAGRYFNPAAFQQPVASVAHPTRFGTMTRNFMVGPGFASADMSLAKSLKVGEGKKVQFRVEAFNVLNHANFSLPDFLLDDLKPGEFTSTVNEGRELQFAIRYTF